VVSTNHVQIYPETSRTQSGSINSSEILQAETLGDMHGGMRVKICGRKTCYGFCEEWTTMYDVIFATHVAIGAKTQCIRCSVNWTRKRGVLSNSLQKLNAESRTAIT
jgi:hypothetical protein